MGAIACASRPLALQEGQGAVKRVRVDARSRWESEVCIGNKRILLLCMDAMAQFGQDGTQAHSRAGGGVASSLCGYLRTQHIRTKMMPLPPPRQHIPPNGNKYLRSRRLSRGSDALSIASERHAAPCSM